MRLTVNKPIMIVVIGSGAGGATTALSLAKLGYHVTLLDARDQVGVVDNKEGEQKKQETMSTSWINPGRAGHGFHYIDLTTGKMLMESTIGVHRKYPGIQIGATHPDTHPLRKGRYFITKNSLFPKDQILKVYSQLQEHYRLLVQKDPENQVIGHPDDFFRILDPEEYREVVDIEKVDVGIETTERLINPALLAQNIFEEVKKEKNITLLTASRVTKIQYGQDKPFIVVLQDGRSIMADQVINCAWEGMEAIDQSLGLFDVSVKCTNRLKVLAVVELPMELREQNSMFFCMGAFCMFSNCGDGRGLMTYAPVTNVANYQDSKIDDIGRKFLSGKASPEEVKSYGESIIKGVAQWIPAMAKARLITVRFGVVKTYGDVDIFDPRSAVHSRDYFGVDCKQIGYIGNACMKLMNLDENAKLVTELFAKSLQAEEKIKALSPIIVKQLTVMFPGLLKLCLEHYLRRQYLPKDFESSVNVEAIQNSLTKQVKKKSLLNMELVYLPKDYPARLMMLNLLLRKMLPAAIAKIASDYCEEIKPIGDSYPAVYVWSALRMQVYVPQSLTRQITTSVDDSVIKRKKIHKPGSMSRSYSGIILLSPRKISLNQDFLVQQKDARVFNT